LSAQEKVSDQHECGDNEINELASETLTFVARIASASARAPPILMKLSVARVRPLALIDTARCVQARRTIQANAHHTRVHFRRSSQGTRSGIANSVDCATG